MSIEVAKDVTMDHHMNGKFTSEYGYLQLFYDFGVPRMHYFFHTFFVNCTALLVAVMVYLDYITKVDKVTIMSWYANRDLVFLLLFFNVCFLFWFRILWIQSWYFVGLPLRCLNWLQQFTLINAGYGYAGTKLVGCLE